ncbi:MAG: type II secretion system F family protein [Gammaproteobacteria bacterium]|nr:type II secretion system F family protein [Gammaproteobacteria bacterium]
MKEILARLDEGFLLLQFGASLPKQLAFLEGIFALMSDGVPPRDALRLTATAAAPLDRHVARHMLRRLREGRAVSSSMDRLFRFDVVSAITAAEQTENFTENGATVLRHIRGQHEARSGVLRQLVMPGVYIVLACAVYAVFAIQVWPKFAVELTPDHWPAPARATYGTGRFISDFWWAMAAAAATAFVGIRLLLRRWTGRGRRLLDRVWPFTLYRVLLAANAIESVGTLLVAGHDIRTALATVSRHASPYTRMYFDMMRRRLRDGRNLSRALDVGFLHRRDVYRLNLLAEHQNLRQVMVRAGAAAREGVLANFRVTAGVLNTVGLTAVAASFALLILSVYMVVTILVRNLQIG